MMAKQVWQSDDGTCFPSEAEADEHDKRVARADQLRKYTRAQVGGRTLSCETLIKHWAQIKAIVEDGASADDMIAARKKAIAEKRGVNVEDLRDDEDEDDED